MLVLFDGDNGEIPANLSTQVERMPQFVTARPTNICELLHADALRARAGLAKHIKGMDKRLALAASIVFLASVMWPST